MYVRHVGHYSGLVGRFSCFKPRQTATMLMDYTGSSLVGGDEGCIGASGKLLCL